MIGLVCFLLGIFMGIPIGIGLIACVIARKMVYEGEIKFEAGGIDWILKEDK